MNDKTMVMFTEDNTKWVRGDVVDALYDALKAEELAIGLTHYANDLPITDKASLEEWQKAEGAAIEARGNAVLLRVAALAKAEGRET